MGVGNVEIKMIFYGRYRRCNEEGEDAKDFVHNQSIGGGFSARMEDVTPH